jgi:hypothetical protein
MRLGKCYLKNFGPYKELEFDYDNQGLCLIAGPTKAGKCFSPGTKIRMYDGSIKNVEDIKEKEVVIGPDGTARIVTGLSSGTDEMYRVEKSDGSHYVVNSSHILTLKYGAMLNKKRQKNTVVNISVKDYLSLPKEDIRLLRGYGAGINYPSKKVLIDPYFLGLWLGDGHSEACAITTADSEIATFIKNYANSLDLNILAHTKLKNKASTYVITSKQRGDNTLYHFFNEYALLGNKHIPQKYLTNDYDTRLNLLAGIIDSDGYRTRNNTFEVVNKSEVLAEDITELARSLGFKTKIKKISKYVKYKHRRIYGDYFRISIYGETWKVPSKLMRKKVTLFKLKSLPSTHSIKVIPIGRGTYYGFSVDKDSLFLLADYTVVHNSTVLDAACWILYGVTSKESSADGMNSWFSDEPTHGNIEVETESGKITVFRTRGKGNQNDLYWFEEHQFAEQRGKDLKDTQNLLEHRLGVNADLYIIGAYMHQFSSADTFFIAKSKDRREVLEKLADLDFPIKLGIKASEARKSKKKELELLEQELARYEGQLAQLSKSRAQILDSSKKWEDERAQEIKDLEEKANNFETLRQEQVNSVVPRIEALSRLILLPEEIEARLEQVKTQIKAFEQVKKEHVEVSKKHAVAASDVEKLTGELNKLNTVEAKGVCPTCSAPTESNAHFHNSRVVILDALKIANNRLEDLSKHVANLESALSIENKIHQAYDKCRQDELINSRMTQELLALKAQVIAARNGKNTYSADAARLKNMTNPHAANIIKCDFDIDEVQVNISEKEKHIGLNKTETAQLNWLYDKSFELRAALLDRAKNYLQNKTNEFLEKFFDADIRVALAFDGADKLEVTITNEGYECPYKQLSGGERCMLKLAFNLAVMKRVEDVAGMRFNAIMLDEALNGLDGTLKSKAFNLLQSLEEEYSSIFLVDHFEEFKNLFSKQFHVVKENGYSVIHAE